MVSVIIPTYNRIMELKLTLDSLCNQVTSNPFEVIVCDDGSSEDTLLVVKEYEEKLEISYHYQSDRGFRAAAARNMGIRAAKGSLCIFVDNGVILHSRAVEEHVRSHKESEQDVVVLGYVYGFDLERDKLERLAHTIDSCEQNFDTAIGLCEEDGMYDIRERDYRVLGDDLSIWPAPFLIFWGNNFSVSKKVLLEVGMFDESFTSWGGEDTELGLSLQEKGLTFVLNRASKSVHYPHKKNHQWDVSPEEEIKNLEKKKAYMLEKHPIEAMKKWMTVYSTIKLNQALLKEKECE